MGVERFFSSIKKDYNFIHQFKNRILCEHLFIDFNSIVHVISQFMLIHYTDSTTADFEIDLIKTVLKYIEELVDVYIISDRLYSIYICIDGVPSMAKINEQKKRRYMGDLLANLNTKPEKFTWSRNNISPGTVFMNNMQIALNSSDFKKSLQYICPNLVDYNVSGIDIPGEGEMKIIDFIKKDTSMKNIVVYSPDSDMIILLLLVDRSTIMLRYNQQASTETNPSYDIIDINIFKDILNNYFRDRLKIINAPQLNSKNIIDDFVFILTVFGDDFLPKLETVRVNLDINTLIDVMLFTITRYGHILNRTQPRITINSKVFLQFLTLLEKKESYFLQRNAKHHIIANYYKIEPKILGNVLYEIREHIIAYIWKFIYFNKPRDKVVSPVNVASTIPLDDFKLFLEQPEPIINHNELMQFTKHLLKVSTSNILNKIKILVDSIYIEIIHYIDAIHDFPSIMDQFSLIKAIIIYFYTFYKLPFNINIELTKLTLNPYNFNSNSALHESRLRHIKENNRDFYFIENKLDKYYKILHPKDEFYYKLYNNESVDYYKIHFKGQDIPKIVAEYLDGYNWVVDYYYNGIMDKTWYYYHNRSPLLRDIILYYAVSRPRPLHSNLIISPLEHFLFVSPFNYNTINIDTNYLKLISQNNSIKYIVEFIKVYKKYYYPLDKIYKELQTVKHVDCSSSHFISKCNLLFMENYIDINMFVQDFRSYCLEHKMN